MSETREITKQKSERLERRRRHGRKAILTAASRTRLIVYRSNKHIYASLRDDVQGKTITGCSTVSPAIIEKIMSAKTKVAAAKLVGERIAEIAKEKGISVVAFDRNGCRYHGRIKALAEGARAGGLQF